MSRSSPGESASLAFVGQADDGRWYVYHDWDGRELSVTIVSAVAEIAEVDPVRVADAFPEYLDGEALDHLFAPCRSRGSEAPSGRLEFGLAGFTVTVYSTGLIAIT